MMITTLKCAFWLGWQIESNWARPLLFFSYAVVRPLISSLIIVVMYWVVTRGETHRDLLAYMVVGNAIYVFVNDLLAAMGEIIWREREQFQVLKYLAIAPISLQQYLLGRGLAKLCLSTLSVILVLTAGTLFLRLPIALSRIDWPGLAAVLILGTVTLACLGVILAALSLLTAHQSFSIGGSLGGIFYLVSGVLYPVSVLPPFLASLSAWIPVTYFVEGVRRALVPDLVSSFPHLSLNGLLGVLAVWTVVMLVLSTVVFRSITAIGRKRGILDLTTAF